MAALRVAARKILRILGGSHRSAFLSLWNANSVVVGVRIFVLVVVVLFFAIESFLFVVLIVETITFILFFLL